MAMLVKPLEDEPGHLPDKTDLEKRFVKRNTLSSAEDDIPFQGGLSRNEAKELQAILLRQLDNQLTQATTKTELKLVVSNPPECEDDSDRLDAWLASWCTIKFNPKTRVSDAVCLLSEKDKYVKKAERSNRVRKIKGTKHGVLYNKYHWTEPRPKSVPELIHGGPLRLDNGATRMFNRPFEISRRTAQDKDFDSALRQVRIEELKSKYGWDKTASNDSHAKPSKSIADNKFHGPPDPRKQQAYNTDSAANSVTGVDPEYRRLRLWLMGREGERFTGLQMFFVGTGVPENDTGPAPSLIADRLERERYHSWLYRREMLAGHINDMVGLKKFFMSTGVPENGNGEWLREIEAEQECMRYSFASRPQSEEQRLDEWLLERYEFRNGMEVPYRHLNGLAISMFERKCHSFHSMWKLNSSIGFPTADNISDVRSKLFKKSNYPWQNHSRRVHPMIAVGEPYDDWSREEKLQKVRENNKSHTDAHQRLKDIASDPNKGKVWPGLGLPKTREEMANRVTDGLARRISSQVMNIALVREVIHEEISDYTAAIMTEFEVAMEDVVERVHRDIASSLEVSKRHSDVPLGFTHHGSGLLIPDSKYDLHNLKNYGQAKVA